MEYYYRAIIAILLSGRVASRNDGYPNRTDLDAIRTHPKLKNYIEPGAPEGYLLIKGGSDPINFISRRRKLGIQIDRATAVPMPDIDLPHRD